MYRFYVSKYQLLSSLKFILSSLFLRLEYHILFHSSYVKRRGKNVKESFLSVLKGPVTYLLKPLLGETFGRLAWTPFVMHWSFYGTVLPGDMQM